MSLRSFWRKILNVQFHVACWKAGMISGPCSVLFAGDAIKYRINDCKARVVITDLGNYDKVNEIRSE